MHEEYATQNTYDNFKKFVANGGVLVLTESNVFTVEIKYNQANDTITFVKGHQFRLDGSIVRRDVEERWTNETSQWMGSNFLPKFGKLYFKDMPFNYTHTEEQYVTNGNATILHDYGIYDPTDETFKPKVAAYQMNYGKGRVISSSIFADKLWNDDAFFKFFRYDLGPTRNRFRL